MRFGVNSYFANDIYIIRRIMYIGCYCDYLR